MLRMKKAAAILKSALVIKTSYYCQKVEFESTNSIQPSFFCISICKLVKIGVKKQY